MFAIRQLSVLQYANGFTMWHYKSEDPIAHTWVAGYFNDATDMMSPGDMIAISAPDGGCMRCVHKTDSPPHSVALKLLK
jgi:hypothetical protein